MARTEIKPKRPQTRGEEIANCVSHGMGAAGALIGTPFLIQAALRHGTLAGLVGASIFAATAAVLYLASTIYHALPPGKAKDVCEIIDHAAIYLLIAGTYTPFTLGVLRGTLGWTLFGLVWTMAIAGVILKSLHGVKYPAVSTAVYIAMGWLILIAIHPLLTKLPLPGLLWLSIGGLAYTGGVAFYAIKHVPYFHFVWHLFVLTGTTCHYFAVLWYSA
ncbi:MAG: hemolysin III family protein [Verrucomicrobiota bacterium]